MTPREKVVARAIIKALRGNPTNMDALSTSYDVGGEAYRGMTIRLRAAIMLEALTNAER